MIPADAVLGAARRHLGYHVPVTRPSIFTLSWGVPFPEPWCADFACRMLADAGHLDVHYSASTIALRGNYRRQGRLLAAPAPGALVFFHWPGYAAPVQHVGIVESLRSDGRLVTLEGNTSLHTAGSQWNGGAVARKVRSRSLVVGYGYPRALLNAPKPTAKPTIVTRPRYPGRPLQIGSRGPAVIAVQHRLSTHADGDYGSRTAQLVRRYQLAHRLEADGVVGAVTWTHLVGPL